MASCVPLNDLCSTSLDAVGGCELNEDTHWNSCTQQVEAPSTYQEEWTGPWNWRDAEEEALLELCGPQQERESCHVAPVLPDEYMSRFLLLKSKIIDTNKLIRKYQEKEKALKAVAEKLAEAQASSTALRSELQLLHQTNSTLSEQLNMATSQLDENLSIIDHQKVLVDQLSAKLEETKSERDMLLDNKACKEDLRAQLKLVQKEFRLYKQRHPGHEVATLDSRPNRVRHHSAALCHDPLAPFTIHSTVGHFKINNGFISPSRAPLDRHLAFMKKEEKVTKQEQKKEKIAVMNKGKKMEDDESSCSDDEEDLLAELLSEETPPQHAMQCRENTHEQTTELVHESVEEMMESSDGSLDNSLLADNTEHTGTYGVTSPSVQVGGENDHVSVTRSVEEHVAVNGCTDEELVAINGCRNEELVAVNGHIMDEQVAVSKWTDHDKKHDMTRSCKRSRQSDSLLPAKRVNTNSSSYLSPPPPPCPDNDGAASLPVVMSPLSIPKQVEPDTALCTDSETDDSMDTLDTLFLSPPRNKRLPTISPLPPSPCPSLSPLMFLQPMLATLSPLPPSPNRATISPLPVSPCEEEEEEDPHSLPPSLPQFSSRAPQGLCVPQPIPVATSNSPSTSSPQLTPTLQQLTRSDSSPFSPPPLPLPPCLSSPLLSPSSPPSLLVPCPPSPPPPPPLSPPPSQTQAVVGQVLLQQCCQPTEFESMSVDIPLASRSPSLPAQVEPSPSLTAPLPPLSESTQEFPPSLLSPQHVLDAPDLLSPPESPSLNIATDLSSPVGTPHNLEQGEILENEEIIEQLVSTDFPQAVGYFDPLVVAPPAKRSTLDNATGQEVKAGSSRSSSNSASPVLTCPPAEFSHVPAGSAQQPLPPSQLEVHPHLRSPQALPMWLTASLVAVQDATNHAIQKNKSKKKKKRKKVSKPIKRFNSQLPEKYASTNLGLLMDGLLSVPIAVTMFSDPFNVPCPTSLAKATVKYLCEQYHPNFESVLKLCWDKCSAVSKKLSNPMDSSYHPPLLKPECVLLSVLTTISLTNNKMVTLLPEIMKALKEAILDTSTGFHHVCACCRMYAALCRLQKDVEQVQFIACELLLKSMASNNLPTVIALASIWPYAFARNLTAPPVHIGDQFKTEGVDMQPLSITLEVVMEDLARKKVELLHKGPVSTIRKLCKWQQLPAQSVVKLTRCLVEVLVSSKHVFIDTPSPLMPRPSKHAYAVVLALRVLACSQGWPWTNDTLIRGHLWTLLQQWNRSPSSVRDATIVCVTRLIGFTAQRGVVEDPSSSSVQQLQKVFISLLQKDKMKKVSLPIQIAVADALLDLSPPHHLPSSSSSSSSLITTTISQWITHLCQEGNATASEMAQIYGPRLQALKVKHY